MTLVVIVCLQVSALVSQVKQEKRALNGAATKMINYCTIWLSSPSYCLYPICLILNISRHVVCLLRHIKRGNIVFPSKVQYL